MSVHSETPRLNPVGDLINGVAASISVNALVHPMGTIKSRVMSGTPFIWRSPSSYRSLYSGYLAICGVDAMTFAVNNLVNSRCENENLRLYYAVASGVASTIPVGLGEHFVTNRQVAGSGYRDILNSFRVRAVRYNFCQGLYVTGLREVLFTTAVFWGTHQIRNGVKSLYPDSGWLGDNTPFMRIVPGLIAGSVAGALTTPCDLVKTRIQVSKVRLPITHVIQSVFREQGWRGLFVGIYWRIPIIAAATLAYDFVNGAIPNYLPKIALREELRKK